MKQRFIIIIIVISVILSGCSTESKKAVVSNDSSYTQEKKEVVKEFPEEDLKTNGQNVPISDKQNVLPAKEITNSSSVPQTSIVKKEVQANRKVTMSVRLFDYLSVKENRDSVGDRANELHGGTMHNSCVYYASEALRRVGIKIPDSMSLIPKFIAELKRQGFKTSYNLEDLKPGDICFTTDVNGVFGGRPTHTYIFMGWESPGVAWIADNQIYDYGDVYHTRLMKFHYLNNQKDKPKEATAFFMYK